MDLDLATKISGAQRIDSRERRITKPRIIQEQEYVIVERLGQEYMITPRQRDVWEILASGASYKQMSRHFGICSDVVKKHIQALLQTTDLTSSAELSCLWNGGVPYSMRKKIA